MTDIRHKSGFTMVELILSMGILTILMTLLMQIFIQVVEMRLSAEADSALAQDMRYIYSRLAYDVTRATVIAEPANPGDSAASLTLTVNGQAYSYAVDGADNLVLTTPTGSTQVNSAGTKVTSVQFVHLGGATGEQTVNYVINLQSTTERASGPVTKQLRGTLGVREI